MRPYLTPQFLRLYAEAPPPSRRPLTESLSFSSKTCVTLPCGPKIYDEQRNLWQARVNGGWRFYFSIEGDTYIIHSIRPHPK